MEFPRTALFKFVAGIVGPQDAEDVVQDVMVKLLQTQARFRGDSQYQTWLFATAKHAALDRLRARQRDPLALSDGEVSQTLVSRPMAAPETAWDLDRAMGRLSLVHQNVLAAAMFHEGDYASGAASLKMSVGSYKHHLGVAKLRLKLVLEGDEQC